MRKSPRKLLPWRKQIIFALKIEQATVHNNRSNIYVPFSFFMATRGKRKAVGESGKLDQSQNDIFVLLKLKEWSCAILFFNIYYNLLCSSFKSSSKKTKNRGKNVARLGGLPASCKWAKTTNKLFKLNNLN